MERTAQAGPILRLNGVTTRYGSTCVLGPLDLQLQAGRVYGLIGPNGAGKSTLIRTIMGIIRPSKGTVELFGTADERGLCAARRRIGYMPDTASSYPSLSASANIEVRCLEWGIERPDIDRLLATVGLAQVGRKKTRAFSMGMRRRLDLAVAMLGDPDLLIMDEPVNGLDPTGIIEIREFIRAINRTRGVTVLVSSHLLSELSEVATDYLMLSKGQLIGQASEQELTRAGRTIEEYYAALAQGHAASRIGGAQ